MVSRAEPDKAPEAPVDLETLITLVRHRWAWKPDSREVRHGLGCRAVEAVRVDNSF